ncbi:hypothetical protein FEM48_Zijuj09G0183400 [Ziziphus jujuba var. spinosa]|uniref:Plastocyanin-like domain-containing protein n=1 Tax=Ziziphus jujuba var. spinosa TaxID=714518 RepID=A0A978UUK0_ZIZJJ|nr:hypothetical protein FEM48_Zijuj09G0183400 [Ziziphus jujuba var. spinosa]
MLVFGALWIYLKLTTKNPKCFQSGVSKKASNGVQLHWDNFPQNLLTPSIGKRVLVLEYNASVELILQGTNVLAASDNHPVHLHGYSFSVVGWGFGIFNPKEDPSYNLVDPPEEITVKEFQRMALMMITVI